MKDVEDSEHFHHNWSKEEDIAKDCRKSLILKEIKTPAQREYNNYEIETLNC